MCEQLRPKRRGTQPDEWVRSRTTWEGGAIHVFFDASRTGYDTTNNEITNNTVSLRGSATITGGVTCYNVTDCLPYWTSKGNLSAEAKRRAAQRKRG